VIALDTAMELLVSGTQDAVHETIRAALARGDDPAVMAIMVSAVAPDGSPTDEVRIATRMLADIERHATDRTPALQDLLVTPHVPGAVRALYLLPHTYLTASVSIPGFAALAPPSTLH
jgi:hypothetical protein